MQYLFQRNQVLWENDLLLLLLFLFRLLAGGVSLSGSQV
jgi:hypothetical protein